MFIKRVDLNPTEVDTLKHLVRGNVDVEIAAYGNYPRRKAQNRKIFESEGITFNHITKLDTDSPNILAWKLIAHIAKTRPEVVVPTEVYYRHSLVVSLLHRNAYSYTFQNIIKRSRSIPIIKRFCRIVVPVQSTGRVWLNNGFPPERIYVVPFGVDTDKFEGTVTDFTKPRVVYVGRVTEEKGLDHFLEGLSRLRVPFEARIVGAGDIPRFSAQASKLRLKGKVEFIPFVERENLHRFYGWSNIFVLPSITTTGWAEQLGMALIEAMAYGRLVIGTRTGAIPDVIGDSGILVKEKSGPDIAKAIEWVTSNPDKAAVLARKSRNRIIKMFDARMCAKKMYEVFTGKRETSLAESCAE